MSDDFNGRYILTDQGHVIPCPDLIEWACWMETSPLRRVAFDKVNDYAISTVFLALDHGWGSPTNDPLHYQPVLWETMVFDVIGGAKFLRRYTSRESALAGHAEVLAWVRRNSDAQESQLKAMMDGSDPKLQVDSPLVVEPADAAQDQRERPEGEASSDEVDSRRIGRPEGRERETDEREH